MNLQVNGKIPPEVWRLLLVALLIWGGVKGGDLIGMVL